MPCGAERLTVFVPSLTVVNSLFDMDGTLVDSTQGVIGAWQIFSQTYPGLNVKEILNSEWPQSALSRCSDSSVWYT